MQNLDDFDKDQLAEYALSVYQVELDMRKSLATLKKEVEALQSKKASVTVLEEAPTAGKKATHLLNRNTGLWFPYTELLAKHLTNAVPCDEQGNPV